MNNTIPIGTQFDRWTTTGPEFSVNGKCKYPCKCICGTERAIWTSNLTNGKSTSCGCKVYKNTSPRQPKSSVAVGAVFGSWTVVGPEISRGHRRYVTCRCVCGAERPVLKNRLFIGTSASCGCVGRIRSIAAHTTHGQTIGHVRTPEYAVWMRMRKRCQDPSDLSYLHYGGRGITVCPEWDDFHTFFKYVGPRPSSTHSLDRIENEGNYEPGNVRWATPVEQADNTRQTRRFTYNGVTHTTKEWATLTGIRHKTLYDRLCYRKWPVEKALTTPTFDVKALKPSPLQTPPKN